MGRYSLLHDIKSNQEKSRLADIRRENAENILILPSEKALKKVGKLDIAGLKQFQAALKALSRDYQAHNIAGGITARTVINRSRRIDIQRCQREIPSAKPVSIDSKGVVKFWVSASGKYGDTSHYVVVQLLNFGAAVAGSVGVNTVLKGALKFDCDCGRHRFWYRYIATVGGFNYGRGESAFPKIRNPDLDGLGCKHILRVMLVIERSPAFRSYLQQAIDRYKQHPNARRHTQTTKQAEQIASKIAKESWQKKAVRRAKLRPLPEKAFNTAKGESIKGSNLKPIDISKQRGKQKSRKTMEIEATTALNKLLQGGLSGLSDSQLSQIQAILNGKE